MEVRSYNAGDEVMICDLFNRAFNKVMTIDYWNWRYRDNPTKKLMISLMWDNANLIGHYALCPVYFNIGSEIVLSGLSMTTMTHPDYRGLGIFPTLADHLYKEQVEMNNLRFVWGFPNSNSHYIFSKILKWKDVEQIPTFSLLKTIFNKSVDSCSIKVVNALRVEYENSFDRNEFLSVNRNLKYLEWRYINHPEISYKVFELYSNGSYYYAVTKIFKSFEFSDKYEIDIVELQFPDDYKAIIELLSAIFQEYKTYDVLRVNIWVPLSQSKHLILEKIGFTNYAPITYLGYRELTSDSISNMHNKWNYQMGDSDVF